METVSNNSKFMDKSWFRDGFQHMILSENIFNNLSLKYFLQRNVNVDSYQHTTLQITAWIASLLSPCPKWEDEARWIKAANAITLIILSFQIKIPLYRNTDSLHLEGWEQQFSFQEKAYREMVLRGRRIFIRKVIL